MDTVRAVKSVVACVLLSVAALLSGCKARPAGPDYGRPLPPGAAALVKIEDPSRWPDMQAAFNARDTGLLAAAARSRAWFAKQSTVRFFPVEGITHAQAAQSVAAFEALLTASPDYNFFRQRLAEQFDCYMSVGWNGQGEVLFTGYYSPIFEASRQRTAEFSHPLYKRPTDLVTDPATGQVLGRGLPGGGLEPYPTRQQIERDPAALGLAGQELVWLRTRLDAYIIQVNGSARLHMRDGTVMYIGYAGTNGREYSSLGEMLAADGKMTRDQVSLPAIRRYFDQHPRELDAYIQRNDRFVFFTTYDGGNWPAGSLGFAVTPWRSLATDKAIFPRGGVVLAVTQAPTTGGGMRAFSHWMFDQDTGGAIRAPGRADIYMGVGPAAEELAGRQAAVGKMYYFFLKPRYVAGPSVN